MNHSSSVDSSERGYVDRPERRYYHLNVMNDSASDDLSGIDETMILVQGLQRPVQIVMPQHASITVAAAPATKVIVSWMPS